MSGISDYKRLAKLDEKRLINTTCFTVSITPFDHRCFTIYPSDRSPVISVSQCLSLHSVIDHTCFTVCIPHLSLCKSNWLSLQEKIDLGELMLSLCYLPTAGRLTVTIIKARNLKAMDVTGSSGKAAALFLSHAAT